VGVGSFFFHFDNKEYKDYVINNYNFSRCFEWVQNLVLILGEEHRLMVFENRVLRKIFGPKADEVTGEWIRLHRGAS
jgi:hypothetical protein